MSSFSITSRLRPLVLGGAGLLASAAPAALAQTPAAAARSPQHADEVTLDELHIVSSPLARSTDEFSQSATVLTDEALRHRDQPSLGEMLDGLPGVSSTYFGPGASRPIIRGLGGERIRVLTDGLGTIDVSATSPDHAVSLEPALSERVEVLRGPSTLLYGSSAVGGVVNVVDDRIPAARATVPLSGTLEGRYDTGANGRTALGSVTGGSGAFAWHASGLWRDSDDIDIPGLAEHHHDEDEGAEEEEHVPGTLPGSGIETTSLSVGGTWFWETGSAGISHTHFDTLYGVPGHEHHHHEEEEEGGGASPAALAVYAPAGVDESDGVRIDLAQRRWDFRAERTAPFGIFRSAKFTAGLADYTHRELEGDEVGTRFDSRGGEGRLELLHQPVGVFEGAVGAQYSDIRLEAEGEEAFMPPTRTRNGALFILEELPTADVRWQFGARLESQDIDVRDGSGVSRDKDALSLSAGGVWSFSEAWALAFSLTRNERLPTAQELFANGPHAATAAYEIGDADLGKEKSTGVDVELRRRVGAVTGSLAVFVNDFDAFIFENPTGETIDELPVYRFVAREARFHGAEAQATWHAHDAQGRGLDIYALVDTVRGTNETDHTPLPRLPPWRVGLGFASVAGRWTFGAEARHAFEQDRVAPYEESSDSYTLVSAHVAYTVPLERGSLQCFVRGSNLTDDEARPHTSFLKELAPLPGRSFTLGARWVF
ncbi:MAG: TonB-dependent receptor [Opitutaceae bacterium]|nr:TonB-dependent receptor [Opitutaceae bacterium]